jgi:hypothetical protein
MDGEKTCKRRQAWRRRWEGGRKKKGRRKDTKQSKKRREGGGETERERERLGDDAGMITRGSEKCSKKKVPAQRVYVATISQHLFLKYDSQHVFPGQKRQTKRYRSSTNNTEHIDLDRYFHFVF